MVAFCPAGCKRINVRTLSVYSTTLSPACFREFQSAYFKRKILEQGLLAVITPANGKQKPLGATMAQECLSMVRRICKYAAHFHLIRPLEITVKLPQKSPKVLLPFTIEEQKKLQSFVMDAPTPRKIGLLLGFQLGLRIGEICGLKWGDFDLSAGTVTIQRTVTRISCENGHTKSSFNLPRPKTPIVRFPFLNRCFILWRNYRKISAAELGFFLAMKKSQSNRDATVRAFTAIWKSQCPSGASSYASPHLCNDLLAGALRH